MIQESVISVIQPKIPSGPKWKEILVTYDIFLGYPVAMFFHKPTKINVISAVEVASHATGLDPICSYHVSMTKNGKKRTTPEETLFVLRNFNIEDADEDNHVPGGIARNFWLPVNENLTGKECPCKETEPEMREDKGSYVWRG